MAAWTTRRCPCCSGTRSTALWSPGCLLGWDRWWPALFTPILVTPWLHRYFRCPPRPRANHDASHGARWLLHDAQAVAGTDFRPLQSAVQQCLPITHLIVASTLLPSLSPAVAEQRAARARGGARCCRDAERPGQGPPGVPGACARARLACSPLLSPFLGILAECAHG